MYFICDMLKENKKFNISKFFAKSANKLFSFQFNILFQILILFLIKSCICI